MGVVNWFTSIATRRRIITDRGRLLAETASGVTVQPLTAGVRRKAVALAVYQSTGVEEKEASSIARLCMHKIAGAGSSVPWIVNVIGDNETQRVTSEMNPVLRIVNSPNSSQSRGMFVYACMLQYQRYGRCFITIWRDDDGAPVDFVIAGYDSVETKVDEVEGIVYEVTWPDPYGKVVYSSNDVIDWRRPGADNFASDEGAWQVAEEELLGDGIARGWQHESMRHRVLPDGILSLPAGSSQEQYEAAANRMGEHEGAKGARKVLVTSGDVDFKSLSSPSAEADFIETRKFYREQIAAMFGVPPPVLGFMENATLANLDASKVMMWEDTVLPMLRNLGEEISRFINDEFSEMYEVLPDSSGVEALKHRIESRAESARALSSIGVPFNLINERLGLGIEMFDGSDISFVNASNIKLTDLSDDHQEDYRWQQDSE